MTAREKMRSELEPIARRRAELEEGAPDGDPDGVDKILDTLEAKFCELLGDEDFQILIEEEAAARGPFPDFLERRVVGFALDLSHDVLCNP